MFALFSKLVSKLTGSPVPSSFPASLGDSPLSIGGPVLLPESRQTYFAIEGHENELRILAQACANRLDSMKWDEKDTLLKVSMYLDARDKTVSPSGVSLGRLQKLVIIKEPQLQTQLLLLDRIIDSFSATLATLSELTRQVDPSMGSQDVSPRLAAGSGRNLMGLLEEAKGLRNRIQEGLTLDARRDSLEDTTPKFEKLLERYKVYLKDSTAHAQIYPSQDLIDGFATWEP
jgi:hypothetical protein